MQVNGMWGVLQPGAPAPAPCWYRHCVNAAGPQLGAGTKQNQQSCPAPGTQRVQAVPGVVLLIWSTFTVQESCLCLTLKNMVANMTAVH